MVIVILDEMDCLLCRHEDVLSQLFMLPKVGPPWRCSAKTHLNLGNGVKGLTLVLVLQMISKSNLILIGISNSIDLTVRALATLERQKFVPELINFPSYTYGQLLNLLQERLQRLPGPVFNPMGLRLCAKKVRPRHPKQGQDTILARNGEGLGRPESSQNGRDTVIQNRELGKPGLQLNRGPGLGVQGSKLQLFKSEKGSNQGERVHRDKMEHYVESAAHPIHDTDDTHMTQRRNQCDICYNREGLFKTA